MEEKRIKIPCNKKVRDYTINNLKKLCGLTVSRAYEKFIEKGAISVEESLAPDNRIEQLIKLINRFTIPKSVPVRPVDKRHMEQFRERWKKHLESLPVNNAADSKPVYLIDAVNRILKRRKSRIQCTRIHLMWHLDLQGEDHMIPEEIATAITKFGLSDWSDVRPLIDNSQYNIRISGNGTKEIEQEEFLKAIEFIYQIPNFHVDEGMKERILNDIKVLQDFFRDKLEDLCDDCKDRFERSPLRILDCKADADKPYMADAPKITDCLCEECQDHFHKVQHFLTEAGVEFELDARLVRGLDYYTKTAFEIKYPPLGAQSAVAGGGRYDGLIEEIGGNPTPAVGFATGLERVLLALEKQNLLPEMDTKTDAFVVALGEEAQGAAFKLLTKLRQAGLKAGMDYAGRSMKAQMKQANKANARFALIIGEDEVKEACVQLKDMEKSEQEKVSFDNIIEKLCAEVKG